VSFSTCCLGSLNLPTFIKGDDITWDELSAAIAVAVRFLDDVIDVTPYFQQTRVEGVVSTHRTQAVPPFPHEIEQRRKSERRIGLGTMGLADLLIRLGLRYGGEESLAELDKLYSFIAKTAYLASVELAQEKGRLLAYTDEFLKSGFMMSCPL